MSNMTPEVEMQVSRLAQISHVTKAMMHRKAGDRELMRNELRLAHCEKLKQKYFIAPCPF